MNWIHRVVAGRSFGTDRPPDPCGPLKPAAYCLNVWVCDLRQVITERTYRAERRQTVLGVALVGPDVFLYKSVQQAAPSLSQGPLILEDLAQPGRLVQGPGVHGGDQGVPGDEVHLQGDDTEQKVSIGGA